MTLELPTSLQRSSNSAAENRRAAREMFCVIRVDVDEADINDTLGHDADDALPQNLAKTLGKARRPAALSGRAARRAAAFRV